MHLLLTAWIILALLFLRLLISVFADVISPLRDVPGPFLSRLTSLWYFKEVAKGTFEKTNVNLHKRYGKIVRLAPNQFSIDDPEAAKVIYGQGSQFPKSAWYSTWKHPDPEKISLFSDQNIARHAEQRKKFQSAYSMTSLMSYEDFVDDCGTLLVQRLAEYSETSLSINLGYWLQCYAFDVIGAISFSKRFGFLDDGKDVGGIMHAIENRLVYGSLAGIFPTTHPVIFPLLNFLGGSTIAGQNYMARFANEHIAYRKANLKDGNDGPTDMITKFLQPHSGDPARFTTYDVTMVASNNIAAGQPQFSLFEVDMLTGSPGSDTTAISLSSIIYHLCRDSSALKKLRAEIDDMSKAGKLSDPITFRESQEMPYLQAVIKEGMRVHSAVGLPLWRVVPEGGATICDRYFPPGATVGINAWVAHRNETIFGPDATRFRPERWLSNDKEQLEGMERYNLTFGSGNRNCIGRHVSYLEMQKVIPQLLRRFDFELDNPQQEWKTWSYWFTKQRDFYVRVSKRQEIT